MIKSKLLLLLIVTIFLFGCVSGPRQLGISQLEWSSYSQEKREILLANYREINREWEAFLKEQENSDTKKVFLAVSIYGGQVMFPPAFITWQKYQPIKFNIFPGECRSIEITSLSNTDVKSILDVCYLDKKLCLDHSRYKVTKKMGTVSIPHSPLWLTGFTYKGIDSDGYVRLNNVTIKIEQQRSKIIKTNK